jgi:large subunit ribosomal protein L31
MQKNIHPQWHDDAKVTCSCGNTFTTGSTQEEIQIDICSECHPYFTGEMKFVDRQGRVDKFKQKMKQAQKKKKADDAKKKQQTQDDQEEDQKSYQEILREKRAQLQQQSQSESEAEE